MAAGGSTLDEWNWSVARRPIDLPGVLLTVLYHPDLARVGQTASASLPPGARLALSRQSPGFGFADAAPEPLDDPYCSRKPLHLSREHGALVVRAGHARIRYTLDGRPGTGEERLTAHALERGVRLSLGRRILLEIRAVQVHPQPRRWHGLVCSARTFAVLRGEIERLAAGDEPVLILGESGTGKEQVARAIHASSGRAGGPFVAVNMSALPGATAAAQLFGHVRGAFTGADHSAPGFFGQAEQGTLLLDALGETPPDIQPLLLRAIDVGEVQPIGGRPRQTRARLIAATDADLEGMVVAGRFRRALWVRIGAETVSLPPLRERPGDLAMQAVAFVRDALDEQGAAGLLDPPVGDAVPWFGLRSMRTVLDQPWPGNARELRGVMRRLASRCGQLEHADLGRVRPDLAPMVSDAMAPPGARADAESVHQVEAALAAHGYQVRPTARALGIAPNTLYAFMKRLALPRAGDLDAADIDAAREAVGDGIPAMAAHLRVSATGLKRRLKTLDPI